MRTSGPGSRPPTIADVARLAGVSRTTVSHALNGIGKVDPRTRERIKQVAAELGYRPNLRAQRLRRGEAKAIALASSMPFAVAGGPSRLGFYMEIAAAAAESALLHGYALVLVPPVQSGSALYSVDIDGAIVVEPDVNDAAAAQLRSGGCPTCRSAGRCRRTTRRRTSICAAGRSPSCCSRICASRVPGGPR